MPLAPIGLPRNPDPPRDAVRGKLVRPTRAGGSPAEAEGDASESDGASEDGTSADLS